MPTTTTQSKSNRRGQESEIKNRKIKLKDKASSFHGRLPAELVPEARMMRRPNTLPNLLIGGRALSSTTTAEVAPLKLTKLLLNVTIQGSVGAVQVLTSPESTVGDLISAAIRQYTKEGRRPIISVDPSRFDLHYSQFSLESLNRDAKLMTLGSRNFFLCAKKSPVDGGANGIATGISSRGGCVGTSTSSSSSSCSNEVEKAAKGGSPWLKFMDLLR